MDDENGENVGYSLFMSNGNCSVCFLSEGVSISRFLTRSCFISMRLSYFVTVETREKYAITRTDCQILLTK